MEMTSVYPVIPKRSEESHKSMIPKNLRFRNSAFQSYYQQVDSMTGVKFCHLHLNEALALSGGSK